MTGAGFEGPLLNECGYNVTKITEAPLTAVPMLNTGGGGPIAEKRMYFFLWEKKCWLLHEVAEQTFHVFYDVVVLEKDSILSHPLALPPHGSHLPVRHLPPKTPVTAVLAPGKTWWMGE